MLHAAVLQLVAPMLHAAVLQLVAPMLHAAVLQLVAPMLHAAVLQLVAPAPRLLEHPRPRPRPRPDTCCMLRVRETRGPRPARRCMSRSPLDKARPARICAKWEQFLPALRVAPCGGCRGRLTEGGAMEEGAVARRGPGGHRLDGRVEPHHAPHRPHPRAPHLPRYPGQHPPASHRRPRAPQHSASSTHPTGPAGPGYGSTRLEP
jgi:hypothetical protein